MVAPMFSEVFLPLNAATVKFILELLPPEPTVLERPLFIDMAIKMIRLI